MKCANRGVVVDSLCVCNAAEVVKNKEDEERKECVRERARAGVGRQDGEEQHEQTWGDEPMRSGWVDEQDKQAIDAALAAAALSAFSRRSRLRCPGPGLEHFLLALALMLGAGVAEKPST